MQALLRGYMARKIVRKMKPEKAKKPKAEGNSVKEIVKIASSKVEEQVLKSQGNDAENPVEKSKPAEKTVERQESSDAAPSVNVSITCEDGSTYTGKFLSITLLIGMMSNKKKNGKGVCVWPNGAKYEGEWKDNQFSGQGVFYVPNGAVIDGVWMNGKLNGQAKYTFPTGETIEGNFANDLPHGKIKHKKEDGSVFEGSCVEGKKCGQGVMTWPDGRKYEGEFKDDEMHGTGTLYGKDSSVYKGQFMKGKKHGDAVYSWKDGRKYVGTFFNGKQHGIGKYTTKEGTKTGKWENGTRVAWIESADTDKNNNSS